MTTIASEAFTLHTDRVIAREQGHARYHAGIIADFERALRALPAKDLTSTGPKYLNAIAYHRSRMRFSERIIAMITPKPRTE